jgi:hypothetical protein
MQMYLRILASLFAFCVIAGAQATMECAQVTTTGQDATLLADSIRPIDSIANTLASRYGIIVSAEEPQYLFAGDMEDVRLADPQWSATHPRAHYLVPKRLRLKIRFRILSDGSPLDPNGLLQQIVETANGHLPFKYRLDVDGEFSSFVPTRTRNDKGVVIKAIPILDRLVSIPPGTRTIAETADLMASSLSVQTGLHVSCCQSAVAGIPWGLPEVRFEADHEPARKVLERLIRLNLPSQQGSSRAYWLLRCDSGWCAINLRGVWAGECGPMIISSPNRN